MILGTHYQTFVEKEQDKFGRKDIGGFTILKYKNYFAKSVDITVPKIVLYMCSKDSKWRMP